MATKKAPACKSARSAADLAARRCSGFEGFSAIEEALRKPARKDRR